MYPLKDKNNKKQGISVIKIKDIGSANNFCKNVLDENASKKTVLFLSGGATPVSLYETLAKEKSLKLGAVALVDERFGEEMHANSNEKMIEKTGLYNFLKEGKVAVHKILNGENINKATKNYEKVVAKLLKEYKVRVAILGLAKDGPTAGLAPYRQDFRHSLFKSGSLVGNYDDKNGSFKQRITLTFKALEKMDLIVILAVGDDKRKALDAMFAEGALEEIPARFFVRPGIAEKTILITDQKF